MKKGITGISLVTAVMILYISLFSGVSVYAAQSGKCTADTLNVRSGAGTSYAVIGHIFYGNTVTVDSTVSASDGGKWYKISYTQSGAAKSGYVSADYIKLTGSSSSSSSSGSSSQETSASSDKDFESYLKKQGFPESYKPALRKLHQQHPNWVFTAQKVGLDWSDVLNEEMVLGRNLVHGSALDSWKSMERGAYNFSGGYWYGLDGSWVAASKEIVSYYLDPRNFLDDTYIFMFENLSYNKNIHNIDGVKAILADSFMKGNYTCPDTGKTHSYAQTFMDAAKKSGVSPYHLASRCRNEQGVNGAPQSLGTVKGYENYFNFFDVQAFATSTMTAAEMGCKYAKTTNPTYMLPWTNQYKSIVGGSIFLGTGYITKEQDTLYLQKFDIVDGGNGLYYHQYMTCVFGQANEAASLKKAYSDKVLASAMEFKIPVYNNMPKTACKKPTASGNNNNLLKSLSISGQKISPSFDKYTASYSLTVDNKVSAVTLNANALDGGAKISGTGRKALKVGKNTLSVKVTAPSGVVRTYKITVTRKQGSTALKKGDVNGDKQITVVDALTILKYNAGKISLDSAKKKRADVDGNGIVDVVDALTVLRYVSGKISKL